jgi:hypothetical protein
MNAAERKAKNDGYRYTGIFETNKEKLKQRADEKRAEGFMVRTIDYSLYAKYKTLKPAEIEKVQDEYNGSKIALINYNRSLTDLENELDTLQTKINDLKTKIWNEHRAAEQMALKLRDSGVQI